MLMVAGGHFAAMIVQVRPPDESEPEEQVESTKKKKKKHKSKAMPEFEILKHTTVHRYTSAY